MRYWTMLTVRHTSTVELGLQWENRRVTVIFLNGPTDSFKTKVFKLNLESLDGSFHCRTRFREHWSNQLGKIREEVGASKGYYFTLDHAHDIFSRYQSEMGVIRKPVKTVARLTAFGWTRSATQIVLMRDAIEEVTLTLISYVPTIRAATKLQTLKGL